MQTYVLPQIRSVKYEFTLGGWTDERASRTEVGTKLLIFSHPVVFRRRPIRSCRSDERASISAGRNRSWIFLFRRRTVDRACTTIRPTDGRLVCVPRSPPLGEGETRLTQCNNMPTFRNSFPICTYLCQYTIIPKHFATYST